MKKLLLLLLPIFILTALSQPTRAQAPNLGTAGDFVLFTSVGAVTNTGNSFITGNVGTNAGAITGFGNVNGVMYAPGGVTLTAKGDLATANTQLNNATTTGTHAPQFGTETITKGVYAIAGNANLDGNLTLDAQNDPNAVFIFKMDAAFATTTASQITLINGAQACNVFWKIDGVVSIGSQTIMRGTVIGEVAINLATGVVVDGRMLSTGGAIVLLYTSAKIPAGCGRAIPVGPAAPDLKSVGCYAIFTTTGDVTNAGTTKVTGDVGSNSAAPGGYSALDVNGTIHLIPDPSTAQAASDLTDLYNYLNLLPYDIELLYPAQFGNNLVLTPHTYLMDAATSLTGTVILNGEGNADAVFVIKINGALTTGTNAKVVLTNGTQAKNVYWNVNGAVSIADYSVFKGTIIANNGAISLATGVNLEGRILSTTGLVTTNAATVTSDKVCGITGIADFIVNNPILSQTPGIFPGGMETATFDFYLEGQVDYNFSSDDGSNQYATIIISFTKLDASVTTPSGTGAALFNWSFVPISNTWVGKTKDVTMLASPPSSKYKITFANMPITESASMAVPNVGFNVTFKDPGDVAPTSLNNFTHKFTYTVQGYPISGKVSHDANGLLGIPANTVDGPGTNIGDLLYAHLLAADGTTVLQTVAVNSDGTYSFTPVIEGSYSVAINTSPTASATPALPGNWVYTGEFNGTGPGSDGTADGILSLGLVNAPVTQANFGIEQLPESYSVTVNSPVGVGVGYTYVLDGSSYGNPASYSTPPLAGNDDEDGLLDGSGTHSVVIKTLPANAKLYYDGVEVTAGQQIDNYTASKLTLEITSNVGSSVQFTFAFVDAAGKESASPASYTINYPYVLTVQFTSFTAKGDNGDARLDWTTSSEQNNAGYGVEHSLDGINWNQLAFVNSKAVNGNSTQKTGYQYIDRDISSGTHYYRLKQTDLDGKFIYSDVAKVDNNSLTTALKVYPNPTSSYIYIEYSGAVKTPIRIIDMNGRMVKSLYTTGTKTRVETNDFAAGTYVVSIDGKTSKFTVTR